MNKSKYVMIDTEDQFYKVFDKDTFVAASLDATVNGVTLGKVFDVLTRKAQYTKHVVEFLHQHDLVLNDGVTFEWIFEEGFPEKSQEFVGRMYFPSLELATLFKLEVM